MENIEIIGYQTKDGTMNKMPLFTMSVAAGIPVPVDYGIDKEIDLNEFLVEHPAATFFARVKGDNLRAAGIRDNDILVVDSALEPHEGKIVLVTVNGDLTIKTFRDIAGEAYLESFNKQFLPLKIEPYMEFRLLGVVTKIIHSL